MHFMSSQPNPSQLNFMKKQSQTQRSLNQCPYAIASLAEKQSKQCRQANKYNTVLNHMHIRRSYAVCEKSKSPPKLFPINMQFLH